jgi:hypothetical protein
VDGLLVIVLDEEMPPSYYGLANPDATLSRPNERSSRSGSRALSACAASRTAADEDGSDAIGVGAPTGQRGSDAGPSGARFPKTSSGRAFVVSVENESQPVGEDVGGAPLSKRKASNQAK